MASGDSLLIVDASQFVGFGSNPATPDTVVDGDSAPHRVLDFDAAATESAVAQSVLPEHYDGGGLTCVVHGAMDSANVGTEKVRIELSIEASTGVWTTAGFAAAQAASIDTDTTNVPFSGTITFTSGAQMDSLAAGGVFRLKIARDHDHADDDAAGDFQLRSVHIKET